MGLDQITIREAADLGPVIARADHRDGAIEVNSSVFYKLTPMMQEFVLCHEVCHLKYEEWDEARTNQLASKLFLSRSRGEADRKERENFLSYLDGQGGYSNWVAALVSAVIGLGTTIYGVIAKRNAGWYSMKETDQRTLVRQLLSVSFESSRKSNSQSAAQFFWSVMGNYTNKDKGLDQFLSRSTNSWVKDEIANYEQKYGFKFDAVTPIDITAYPLAMVAVGIVAGFIVYKIIKKLRK